MRFLIQDYLAHLKERDELDAILPDLLRGMGMQIVKLAFRGEVEHGVDIAAVGQEEGETFLYLIQVKQGDIDQRMWDSGPNSVRTTLNNLLDVPFQDLTQPRLQRATRKTILVHNGILRENVKARVEGYLDQTFRPCMQFDRWDLDRLAGLFQEYLFNERMLLKQYQRLFKRTLVFLDVPDYDLSDFRQLMQEILPNVSCLRKSRRSRIFGLVRLILAMIRQQCQDQTVDNLSPAAVAYECALLSLWGWMWRNGFFGKPVLEEFARTYSQYLGVLGLKASRIMRAVQALNGLAFGGTFESVEYPLRTFRVIEDLGLLTTALVYLPASEFKRRLLPHNIELLINAIQNNPSRHRPLLDNHSISIFLGMWPLLLTGQSDFVKWWLEDILEHLAIRKRLSGMLPEFHNNIDAVIEYEATANQPIDYIDSSSTLIYMLFEFCLLLDAEDLYLKYRPVFEDVNFQIWYPPENVEEILYSREVFEGDTEVIHGLPDSFEEFRLDVQARHQFDRVDYSPVVKGLPVVLLLANKHFHTPVFSFWWRKPMFSQPSATEARRNQMESMTNR